jgi:hypothetical protein
VAWFDGDEVWDMIAANELRDGLSLTALLWYFARLNRQADNETGEWGDR